MYQELKSDMIDLLTDLQGSIRELRTELHQVRAELQSRPTTPTKLQEWYSTSEASKLLQKFEYTVRQWCNEGRINAVKREERRGGSALWKISTEEVARYQNEGQLPPDLYRNAGH